MQHLCFDVGGNDGSGSYGGVSSQYFTAPPVPLEPDFDTPLYDYDNMTYSESSDGVVTETFYKNGKIVGCVTSRIDEHGQYCKIYEYWLCGDGNYLITEYYEKGETNTYEWVDAYYNDRRTKTLTATKPNIKKRRFISDTPNLTNWSNSYNRVSYHPNGRMSFMIKSHNWNENHRHELYSISPEGIVGFFRQSFGNLGDNWYSYYVYPSRYSYYPPVPFDPSGHLRDSYLYQNDGGVKWVVQMENKYSGRWEYKVILKNGEKSWFIPT